MRDFFEVVESRRSVRKYTQESVPSEVMLRALDAAIKAPNSSNTQTWQFYWIHSAQAKQQVARMCLNQSAARTAQELLVIVANPKLWKRSQKPILHYLSKLKAPKSAMDYYKKLVPFMYTWGWFHILSPIKWLAFNIVGLFRPLVREPVSKSQIQAVAIKSAALAAENFSLAIAAQGFGTCMMEGFDSARLSRFLKLESGSKIVMVVSVGRPAPDGLWGPQFRLPLADVLTKI